MDYRKFLEFDCCYLLEIPDGKAYVIHYSDGHPLYAYFGNSFVSIDETALYKLLDSFGQQEIRLHGIANDKFQFVVFDIEMNGDFLDVATAKAMTDYLKLPFVQHRVLVNDEIEQEANRQSIELRPMKECIDETGDRIIYRSERSNTEIISDTTEVKKAKTIQSIIDALPITTNYVYEAPKENEDK